MLFCTEHTVYDTVHSTQPAGDDGSMNREVSESTSQWTVPVIVNKSYEERVEGIQVSDQYGELVHDEELRLGHLTPPLRLTLLLVHHHNSCFLWDTVID